MSLWDILLKTAGADTLPRESFFSEVTKGVNAKLSGFTEQDSNLQNVISAERLIRALNYFFKEGAEVIYGGVTFTDTCAEMKIIGACKLVGSEHPLQIHFKPNAMEKDGMVAIYEFDEDGGLMIVGRKIFGKFGEAKIHFPDKTKTELILSNDNERINVSFDGTLNLSNPGDCEKLTESVLTCSEKKATFEWVFELAKKIGEMTSMNKLFSVELHKDDDNDNWFYAKYIDGKLVSFNYTDFESGCRHSGSEKGYTVKTDFAELRVDYASENCMAERTLTYSVSHENDDRLLMSSHEDLMKKYYILPLK